MRFRSVVLLVTFLSLPLVGNLWSTSSRPGTRSVTLFFTGYVQGGYAPCGCPVQPSGGLARRAGFMKDYRAKTGAYDLQLDLGNYFSSPGPNADAVNNVMLQSLKALPIRVLNLGTEDLHYWGKIREFVEAKQAPTQVISTNLFPKDPAVAAPPRYAVVEIPGERIGLRRSLRVGFVGFCDPAGVKPNSRFRASDPAQAFAAVRPELMKRADFLVVLADLPRAAAKQLPVGHPEVLAVLLAEKQFVMYPPEQVNNAVILSSTERGRFLGQLEMQLDDFGRVTVFKPDVVQLVAGVPEDAGFLAIEKQLTAQLPATW